MLQKLRQLDIGPVSYSKVCILGSLQLGVCTKVIDFFAKFQLNRGSYEGALEMRGENQDQNKLLEYRTSSSIPGSAAAHTTERVIRL